jgi:hypothetical protein
MKTNKIICTFLVWVIVLTSLIGAISAIAEVSESPVRAEVNSRREITAEYDFGDYMTHKFEDYSIDEIRRYVNDGGVIYRNVRIQSDTEGTKTYRVPIYDNEIEYLTRLQEDSARTSSNQTLTVNPFPTTRIRHSGRSDEDSIVIILFGDGFAAAQYGTWPNPAPNTVLWHANNAIDTMLNTHPFGLFGHLFTVYVVHSAGTNPNNPLRG